MAVVVDSYVIALTLHGITVRFAPHVLQVFDSYRQRRWFSKEAGGQLFANVQDDLWEIVLATGPRSTDRRGRFSFWPDRRREQLEIEQYFANGLTYVGDWHTHPEKVPQPSNDDLVSIRNVVRESTFYTSGLLLCIVGLAPFPEGLYVSLHV